MNDPYTLSLHTWYSVGPVIGPGGPVTDRDAVLPVWEFKLVLHLLGLVYVVDVFKSNFTEPIIEAPNFASTVNSVE